MGYPSLMKMTTRSATLPKIVVVLVTNSGHDGLEAGQLVLEIFDGVMQDIKLRGLLSYHLTEVASLTSLV